MKNFNTNIIIGGRVSPSLQNAFNAVNRFAGRSTSTFRNVNGSVERMNRALSQTAREAKVATGAILAAGSAVAVGLATKGTKAMIEQASSMEQYRNTLNIVMKDTKKAGETFKWAVDYANKTPFETAEIVDATVKLQSYGLEAQKVMPFIGDMAAAMGKGMDQAVEAVADAQTGELERLKEFGITKEQIVKQANKKLGKIEVVNNKGQITNQRAFNAALMSLMQDRFDGGMQVQANSFKGLMSTISGVWKSGLAQMAGISQDGLIIDGSMFDIIKDKVAILSGKMQELQKSGKFDEIQKSISQFTSDIADGIENALPKIMDFGSYVLNNGPKIMNTVKFIGIAFLTWKAISFVSSAVSIMIGLAGALRLAKVEYLPLLFAKMQDMGLTAGIIGLYTWDAIVKGASAVKTFLLAGAQGALNIAVGIGTGVMGAFGAVMAFLTSPIGLVILAVGLLVGGLIYLWNTSDSVREAVINFFSNLKQWGVDACNTVINALNKMIDLINKIPFIDIPNIPNVGGDSKGNSKKTKAYATGGIITSPHYGLVGEAGPEAIIPLKRNNPRSMELLQKTSQILGVKSANKPLEPLKTRNVTVNNNKNKSDSASSVTLVYNPTIQCNTGNNDDISDKLQENFERLKEFIEQYFEDKERVDVDEGIFSI